MNYRRDNVVSHSIHEYIEKGKAAVEAELKTSFTMGTIPERLYDSISYSLFAGGKRLRPILLFASHDTFQTPSAKSLKTAAALEMIHTYSLIHDDLPAMDDDDYRRGKLTNHRKFDEATAILAGDALLTYSFEMIADDPTLTDKEKVYITKSLAHASGPDGMVAGQILDIEGEKRLLSLTELEKVHVHKTGKLISFAIDAGAYLGGASETQRTHLQKFAYYLGLIFQVQDDILDVIGNPDKLGKPVGSDSDNDKSTYPNLLGLEGAKKQKRIYEEKAIQSLADAKAKDTYLLGLLHYFSQRDH